MYIFDVLSLFTDALGIVLDAIVVMIMLNN